VRRANSGRRHTSREGRAIRTLSQVSTELNAHLKVIRTLVVEHGVEFEIIGKTWVFSAPAAARIGELYAAHQEKAARLGIKPYPKRGQESAGMARSA
jgi:hypothetical protein